MTYDELCTAVGKIDKEAEQYMRTDARELEDFVECGCLGGAFVWRKTPQGYLYWHHIDLTM